ncbi:MAG: hypothetical protein WA058_01900 [Minisyncoccia bacterium]
MIGLTDIKKYLGIDSGNEILDSTENALRDRLTSPFYGYFIIAWLLVNWRIVYAAFFINQAILMQKTGLMRNEYLQSIIPSHSTLAWWLNFLLLPFILTCLAFWVFPVFTRRFFRKSISNKLVLKGIEIHEISKVTIAQTDLVQQKTTLLKEEAKKAKEEKETLESAPEIIWQKDFDIFAKTRYYKSFDSIINSVYQRNGISNNIDKDLLVYADSNGVVEIKTLGGYNRVSFTPKGRFFLKKYSELKGTQDTF